MAYFHALVNLKPAAVQLFTPLTKQPDDICRTVCYNIGTGKENIC